jgi:hypothetical protein
VDRATFDTIWHHCVDLLGRGFRSGSILTVDPEDAIALGKPWTRRCDIVELCEVEERGVASAHEP